MKKILVCLLFFSSCVSNNNRTPQIDVEVAVMPDLPYHILLEKEIGNIKPACLSEVGSTITYIPLETVSESLLTGLNRVIVTDSFYIVNSAFVFDSAGNFLRQIGRKGQGPGEYSMFINNFLSFDKNKLYLLVESYKVLEFTIEGKFLNSYKLDSLPTMILPIRDDLFVYYCRNTTRNPIEQSLVISDLNNNIQKTYKNYHKRIRKSGSDISFSVAPFYIYQENIRFKEFGSDTLYTVTEEELIPYCILDMGKRKIPADFSINNDLKFAEVGAGYEYPGAYWILNIVEDSDNLYITLNDFKNDLYGFINKNTQVVKVTGDQGFRNDIDGGLPFFPINSHNGSILVGGVNAFDLREHVLNSNAAEMRRLYGQKYDDLVKFANSIDDEDNPIIVLVKK